MSCIDGANSEGHSTLLVAHLIVVVSFAHRDIFIATPNFWNSSIEVLTRSYSAVGIMIELPQLLGGGIYIRIWALLN